MKKIIVYSSIILIIFSLFVLLENKAFAEENDSEIVEITDEALKTKLTTMTYWDTSESKSKNLDADKDGNITIAELQKLTSLDFYYNEKLPQDFSSLRYASNLETLSLTWYTTSIDIKAMGIDKITSLKKILLGSISNPCDISLENIEQLTNLRELQIMGTKSFTNYEGISTLTNLTFLQLNNAKISDVSFLSNFNYLTTLVLNGNGLKEIPDLEHMTNLNNLTISDNSITRMPKLPNSLTNVGFSNVNIKRMDFVNLPRLISLILRNANIEELTLSNLPALERLAASDNKYETIGLTGCNKLTYLELNNNYITDISFIGKIPTITTLSLNGNIINPNTESNKEILDYYKSISTRITIDEYSDEKGPIYKLSDDKKYYIVSGFFGPEETEVTIPKEYKGLPVKEIGKEAFYKSTKGLVLEKIVLPETIEVIGEAAFGNLKDLKEINLPDSISYIGIDAFYDCESLEEIIIPTRIDTIEECMFWGCKSLKKLDIPENITTIKSAAFALCSSLEEIYIPDSVVEFDIDQMNSDAGMFDSCVSLKSIRLSKNIKNLSHNAFGGCKVLEKIEIPEGIETIPSCAFSGCDNLTTLVLPYSFKGFDCMVSSTDKVQNLIDNLKKINAKVYIYSESDIAEIIKNSDIDYAFIDSDIITAPVKVLKSYDEAKTIFTLKETVTVEEFISEEFFYDVKDIDVKVYDEKGNEKNTDNLGSKNIVKVEDGKKNVIATYTVIVPGDISGNGKVKIFDSFQILKGVLSNDELEEMDVEIRDYNNDKTVTIFDAFQYLRDSLK